MRANENTGGKAGVIVAGLAPEAANQNEQSKHSTDQAVLQNRSTATKVQLSKLLALLKQGPKTTVEIRRHGIMMPATRIFELRRKHKIISQLVTHYDDSGFRHKKVARYHLVAEAASEVSA